MNFNIPKIPKGEKLEVQHTSNGILTHITTSNLMRDTYYLYKVNGDKLEKVGRGDNPTELEKYMK